MDGDSRKSAERIQISLLAYGLAGIELAADGRSEIANFLNYIIDFKQALNKSFNVEPFEPGLSQGTVVKVKSIDVDEGAFH
jgi:hypothetical protein